MAQWLKSLTFVQRVPSFLVEPPNKFPLLLTPLLHLTCGAGAVDNKDLTVSSDKGNV